jgi:hypothetical protein
LDGATPAEDWAKDAIAGPALGPSIHLGPVLLVLENHR